MPSIYHHPLLTGSFSVERLAYPDTQKHRFTTVLCLLDRFPWNGQLTQTHKNIDFPQLCSGGQCRQSGSVNIRRMCHLFVCLFGFPFYLSVKRSFHPGLRCAFFDNQPTLQEAEKNAHYYTGAGRGYMQGVFHVFWLTDSGPSVMWEGKWKHPEAGMKGGGLGNCLKSSNGQS